MYRTQSWLVGGTGVATARITYRRAAEADRERLGDLLAGLTATSAYLRFFTGITTPPPALLRTLLTTTEDRAAWVATDGTRIVGHACWALIPGAPDNADLGLVVADEYQGQGIGRYLGRLAVSDAQESGARFLQLEVLAENRLVHGSIARRWVGAASSNDGPVVVYHLPLVGAASSRAQKQTVYATG